VHHSGCRPDRSDYNVVAQNTIAATSAENLDIKEGTQHARSSATRSVAPAGSPQRTLGSTSKGNDWIITGNRGATSPADGFQTHSVVDGWGTGNVFSGNTATVDGAGYAIHLAPVLGNVVRCSNTETGARHDQQRPLQNLEDTHVTGEVRMNSNHYSPRPTFSVLGTGYLGATHAICMASIGFDVIGVERGRGQDRRPEQRRCPVLRAGTAELLESTLASGRPAIQQHDRRRR